MPIAIALGNNPLVTFMASTPVGYTQNEYEFVGALQDGVPIDIVKADLSDHLYVPAGSEVILEGYIEPAYVKWKDHSVSSRVPIQEHVTSVLYVSSYYLQNRSDFRKSVPWYSVDRN